MSVPIPLYYVTSAMHHVQGGHWQKACPCMPDRPGTTRTLHRSPPSCAEHHAGASFLASAAALPGIAAPTVGGAGAPVISLTASSATPAAAPLQEPDPEAAHTSLPVGKSARHHGVCFGDDAEPGAGASDAHAAPAAVPDARASAQPPEGRRRATQHLRAAVADATRGVRTSVAQATRRGRASVAQAVRNARASVYVVRCRRPGFQAPDIEKRGLTHATIW